MQRCSGVERQQVFQQKRHAAKRSVRQRRYGRGASLVEQRRDHGVDGRIQALDAGDDGVHEFERRDLAATDQVRLRQRIQSSNFHR